MTTMVEEGRIRDAVRILQQNDSMAPNSSDTLSALQLKHPEAPVDRRPLISINGECLSVSPCEVLNALDSFPTGSSGGIDGLTPQHLKECFVHINESPDKSRRLSILSDFMNIIISGKVPKEIRPIFFAARLIALNKKDGGIRPIAVSNSFRRMASKLVAKIGAQTLASFFNDTQFGIGVRSGCEVAVHLTRQFTELNPSAPLVKIDFANAFNSIRRDCMMDEVNRLFPSASAYIHSSYAEASYLQCGDGHIMSAEGVQQGDPIDPLLFCLTIQPIIKKLKCPLNAWYMDDGTIAGPIDVVSHDYHMLTEEATKVGLKINQQKCEVLNGSDNALFSSAKVLTPSNFSLLGAPVTQLSTEFLLVKKKEEIQNTLSKLSILSQHHAYKILQLSFGSPKLVSLLRCSPCHANHILKEIDTVIQDGVERIFNVSLTSCSRQQAALPIKMGGLGIREIKSIALSAFVASFNAAKNVCQFLTDSTTFTFYKEIWCQAVGVDASPVTQRELDHRLCIKSFNQLLQSADEINASRLNSVAHPNSGDWLKAIPSRKFGVFLEDEEFRSAVCLRLGLKFFEPHKCKCGINIDEFGGHCFACSRNHGKILRHTMVNDVISSSLRSAGIPNRKEPENLSCCPGLRPDGITLIPFSSGRCLTWDVSCPHPLCASHLGKNKKPGGVANFVETTKNRKYSIIKNTHTFSPIIVDTLGAYGDETQTLLANIGKRLFQITGNKKAASHFRQRISIAVQKGNYKALSFSLLC